MTATKQRKPTLLFITPPEAGQANCHLAVISSLKAKHGENVDIHLASFVHLRKRVSPESGIIFHPIKGVSMAEGLMRECGGDPAKTMEYLQTPSGFFGAILSATRTTTYIQPDTPEEYLEAAQDVSRIIEDVNPDYILVDFLFNAARDAIRKSGRKENVSLLIANTAKDVVMSNQGLRTFTFPCVVSGYPYPLPWFLYPSNIFLTLFYGLWLFIFDKRHKLLNRARNAAGYSGVLPLFDTPQERTTLCMSSISAELPLIIPDWMICCGPILQASKPLREVDGELYKWCNLRPTVLISLGTNMKYSMKDAMEMYKSIRILLDKRKDIQVIWKLVKLGEYEIPDSGSSEIGDRLRIVDWLSADPISILKSGNIICFVNHGGSNSYHEALYAGVPQVVLPAWTDCYDFPARVQYLGIGAWGNRKASPGCSEAELTEALLQVIGRTPDDMVAKTIRERAKELGRAVTRDYTREGRAVAADHIWAEMQKTRATK